MTIYLDILILTNLFVTYFLLQSTKALLHRKTSKKRLFVAALLGGVSATIILLPPLPGVLYAGVKLMLSFVLCWVGFGTGSLKLQIKTLLAFYSINFLYAGLMMAIWQFASPMGMQVRNGVAYFNLSAMILLLSTLLAYLGLQLATHLLAKTPQQDQLFEVQINCDGKAVLAEAFLDTGNQLTDFMTGLPVVFCELALLREMMPPDVFAAFEAGNVEQLENTLWRKRVRMLPLSSVTGEGIVTGFKPEELLVHFPSGAVSVKEGIVAVSQHPLSRGEFSMLIGPSLLS